MLSSAEIIFCRCILVAILMYCVLLPLLQGLEPHSENDPDSAFPVFYKQVARKLAPELDVIPG